MAVQVRRSYILGPYRLEPDCRRLTRDDAAIHITGKPFQVLLYLIEHRDRLATRAELLDRFWEGRDVYDVALSKCVSAIRKALADKLDAPQFIETRWAEGYRYIGPFEEVFEPEATPSFDVEKTRGLMIVVEEEFGEDSLAGSQRPSQFPVETVSLVRPKLSYRTVAVSVGLAVLVCALLAWLFKSSFNAPASNQPWMISSVAVLPLKNLTGDPSQEYFSDGMTESLIAELSKINSLRVISRGSVFTLKDQESDPRALGRRLGVAAILEGSLRENGDKVRVQVRLVNTEDGQVLWSSDNYNRLRADVFEIQDDIARSVATHLRLKLSQTDERRMTRRQTNSPAAYQAYVRGIYFRNQKNRETLPRALESFQEAIRLDPNYALAYAGLASYYTAGIWYADLPPKESIAAMKAAALKSLELDENLSEAHVVRARAAECEWDWETERKELERAIELDPNNAQGYHAYAFYLSPERPVEALAAIKRTQELDPISPSVNVDVGVMLTRAGHYDEAIEVLKRAVELDPQFQDVYANLGRAYERKGMLAEAFAEYMKASRLRGETEERIAAYRAAHTQAGMEGFWRKRLVFLKQDAATTYVPPFEIARLQARLGERDAAFETLEKLYSARDPYLPALNSAFEFDTLRSDPRFANLARRVWLAQS